MPTDYLREKFDSYGIIIDSAMLINIEPDEETKAAIQKKITAQQELELAKVQAETARIDAEKEKEVALIEAEKNKETASINAEKVKIEAQGKADANGKLPYVQGSSSSIIDMKDFNEGD